MKKLMIAALLTVFNTAVLAEGLIVTTTKTWKSVPITIDADKHLYTYEGTLPDGDYYYTYSGYRCVKEKITIDGVEALVFNSGVAGGTDIYCYPE